MSQDQQTYRRATAAAGVGLAVQVALGIVVALVGLWSQSPALHAATWHVFGGVPIWIILLLVYYQHRLERAEALEAEALARSDQHAAALFDARAEDLQVARRRLDVLHKWGLGGVSVVLAVYLLGVGLALFSSARSLLDQGRLVDVARNDASNPLVLMFIMVVVAFLAFVAGRYISGMTKIKPWQLLRGGASYLMGTALVAAMLLAAALFSHFGNDQVLAAMALAIPAFSALVGLEITLTFLLNVYRPRKPGEVPRPAFDSRVLGLLTTPESLAKAIGDTLNYQFGFEISRSWFYRLLGRAVTPLVAASLTVLLLLSCIAIVEPHEQAVVTRFGKLVEYQPGVQAAYPPGLHFKAPWPIGRVAKKPVGRLQQVVIGSEMETSSETAILWTNKHSEGDEQFMLTAPTPRTDRRLRLGVGEEEASDDHFIPSLVAAQVIVQYRIGDLAQYLGANLPQGQAGTRNPEQLLQALAEEQVTRYFVTQDIDSLLGAGRIEAGQQLRERMQAVVNKHNLGIDVVFVGIPAVHPPQGGSMEGQPGPAEAFLEQIGALAERQATLESARREAIEMLAQVAGSREKADEIYKQVTRLGELKDQYQQLRADSGEERLASARREVLEQELEVEKLLSNAGGAAAEQIYEARAYRWERAVGERAAAERFLAQLMAYGQAPRLYSAGVYLQTLAEGMGQSRKIVQAAEQTATPTYRLDLKDAGDALSDVFGGE